MRLLYLAAAFLVSGAVAHACGDVSALSGGCYSQNVVVEKFVQPRYVERIVQRVEHPRVERVVVRERVVKRDRLSDRVQRLVGRNKVVRRERIVERSY